MKGKPSWTGNCFMHPLVDYLAVSGLLSFFVLGARLGGSLEGGAGELAIFPLLFFFVNMTHFSTSTVRLYDRRENFSDHPFLTRGLPLATLAVVTVVICFADTLGRGFAALFMTWAPYHYSRQAYGLAVMYAHRSGVGPSKEHSRWLLWACMLPFWLSLLTSVPSNSGLGMFIPTELVTTHPAIYNFYVSLRQWLGVLSVLVALGLVYRWHAAVKRPVPLIIPLLLASNAVWLSVVWSSYASVWHWVTIFHGLQYIVVITYFHARERSGPGWREALRFYGLSVAVSYGLWCCMPFAYQWLGLGYAQSLILVGAAINIHHFIVDAYIWSVRTDANVKKTVLARV
jgi:hypothetical protein